MIKVIKVGQILEGRHRARREYGCFFTRLEVTRIP